MARLREINRPRRANRRCDRLTNSEISRPPRTSRLMLMCDIGRTRGSMESWTLMATSFLAVIGPKREIYGACASIWPKGELKGGRQICRPKSTTRFATLVSIGSRTKTRSEEHTSELQSLMRISYAVICLKKKTQQSIKYKLSNY